MLCATPLMKSGYKYPFTLSFGLPYLTNSYFMYFRLRKIQFFEVLLSEHRLIICWCKVDLFGFVTRSLGVDSLGVRVQGWIVLVRICPVKDRRLPTGSRPGCKPPDLYIHTSVHALTALWTRCCCTRSGHPGCGRQITEQSCPDPTANSSYIP